MCVPDLLGTQGTFLLFTTRPAERTLQGRRHRASTCRRTDDRIETTRRRARTTRFVEGKPPLDDAAAHRARPRAQPRHASTLGRHEP